MYRDTQSLHLHVRATRDVERLVWRLGTRPDSDTQNMDFVSKNDSLYAKA
jgi:hypothetical protein